MPKALGIDCGNSLSLTYKLQSIRIMLAITAELVYKIFVVSVHMAFPKADMVGHFLCAMALNY